MSRSWCGRRLAWLLAVWLLVMGVALASCSAPRQEAAQPPPSQTAPSASPGQPAQPSQTAGPAPQQPAQPAPGAGPAAPPPPAGKTFPVSVHFLAVGQGDSVLIQTASGESVVVDGGPRDAGPGVVRYLKDRGVKELAYVVGTHPHEDHVGGLIRVLETFPVGTVIDSAVPHTTRTFETYLLTIKEKGIRYVAGRAGQVYRLGDLALRVLWPGEPPPEEDLNACSVVLLVTAGDVRILLTGDLPGDYEAKIATAAQVLKVAHHGSKSSTTSAFLRAVKPGDAVICVGDNPYGHPSQEALKRLADAGVRTNRTDLQGTVVLTTDGKTYSFDKKPWEYQAPAGPGGVAPAPSGG
ncbi:MAG: MBL fold metallo-hydrolase, partial [Bacillota bacterium]